MLDRAKKATGDDKKIADAVVANMRYGLIPEGPARRAVVFGGSNVAHLQAGPRRRRPRPSDAAKRLHRLRRPARNGRPRLAWTGSNPGNLRGFKTNWMKQRLEQIKFLEVTTSMLPYGIPFPVMPQSPRS